MVITTEAPIEHYGTEYQHTVVYADREQEIVLHEGELRLLANAWVELPSGRLLSPDAVHHIDPHPDRPE